jgi:hypothetical protein
MTDPIMTSIAAALAGKAAEAVVDGGKAAWGELVRLVRTQFRADKTALRVLERAESWPVDHASVMALAQALERITTEDAEFRTRLLALWPTASAELSAEDGGVVNSNTGTVAGHLIQARDLRLEGGLHLGDVQPG